MRGCATERKGFKHADHHHGSSPGFVGGYECWRSRGRVRVRECRQIEEDLQRLACFDQLAAELGEVPSPGTVTPNEIGDDEELPAGWILENTTNPLDDTPRVVARLKAVEGQGRLGGGGPVELYVRCQSGKVEVFIWWREFLGGSAVGRGLVEVTTRFDKEEPTTRKWNQSTDMQMTFVPVGAEGFAMKLTGRSRLVAMVTPVAANPVTAVFDLAGADRAVEAVRSACRPASEGAG